MERRRSSALQGLPPAVAASVAATEALRLCSSIRAAAADVPTCRRDCRCVYRAAQLSTEAHRSCRCLPATCLVAALLPCSKLLQASGLRGGVLCCAACRTLARFVGKVMLVLEALHSAMELQQRQAAAAAAAAAAAELAGGGELAQPTGSAGLAAAWSSAALRASQILPQGPQAPQPGQQGGPADAALAQPPLQQLSPEALVAAWAEAAADVQGTLAAVSELVSACGGMGRLQASTPALDAAAAVAASQTVCRRPAACRRNLSCCPLLHASKP